MCVCVCDCVCGSTRIFRVFLVENRKLFVFWQCFYFILFCVCPALRHLCCVNVWWVRCCCWFWFVSQNSLSHTNRQPNDYDFPSRISYHQSSLTWNSATSRTRAPIFSRLSAFFHCNKTEKNEKNVEQIPSSSRAVIEKKIICIRATCVYLFTTTATEFRVIRALFLFLFCVRWIFFFAHAVSTKWMKQKNGFTIRQLNKWIEII